MKSRDQIMECGFLVGTSIRSIQLVTLYMVLRISYMQYARQDYSRTVSSLSYRF